MSHMMTEKASMKKVPRHLDAGLLTYFRFMSNRITHNE